MFEGVNIGVLWVFCWLKYVHLGKFIFKTNKPAAIRRRNGLAEIHFPADFQRKMPQKTKSVTFF